MGIREAIAKIEAMPVIATVPVPGLGDVRVKRLKAAEAEHLKDAYDLISATILNDDDTIAFPTPADVKKCDVATVKAMLDAYYRVNSVREDRL